VASPVPFDIVVRSDGERHVLVVSGEIDCATAPSLHSTLRRELAEGHHVLDVDLGPVTFMDGSVLTFLLTAKRAVAVSGGSLTVVGHNRLLTRLLRVTALTDAFPGG
jgi:anti-sigma B factor antagonist